MSKLISSTMNTKLNAQVTNEMGASQKYLAMACAFEDMGLKILAKRFGQQSDEERAHALKILDYIQQAGGTVKVDGVPKPTGSFSDPMKILKGALDAELKVTQQINALVALADKEKDYATRSFMNWFVDEQVEEVASMRDLVQLAELTQDMYHVEARVRHMMQSE